MDYCVNRKKYYMWYVLVFSILIGIFSIPFFMNGTTLIGKNDSVIQHFPFLYKIRDFYLCNFNALFTGRGIKQIDFNTFFGVDIIQTYNYYGYGNPVFLILLLFKESDMIIAYHLVIIISIFLGGIVFSEYCFYHKKNNQVVLVATMVYILSPMIISNIHQLCFVYIIYQIPLAVLGFEKIFKEKKYGVFIFSIFITALSGFYFLYMITIALAIYGVYLSIAYTDNIIGAFKFGLSKLLKVSISYIIGIGLAAPIFIPTVYGFLNSYRNGANVKPSLLYSINEYIMEIPCLFVYGEEKGFMLNLGILIITIMILKNRKYYVHNKIIIVLFIMSQIALVGYVFNGFSYPSMRWFILTYFYFSYLVTMALDNKKRNIVVVIMIMTVIQPFVYIMNYSKKSINCKELKEYVDNMYTYEKNERVEFEGNQAANKWSYYKTQSPWIYNSIIPKTIGDAMLEFGNCELKNTSCIGGLNERPELEALFNIGCYYSDKESCIPYGFEKKEKNYINRYSIPFGYTYSSVVAKKSIENLNPVDKSFVCLNYGVGSEDVGLSIDADSVKTKYSKEIPFKISKDKNKYCISFDKQENVQVYMLVDLRDGRGCSGKIYVDGKYINLFQHWTTKLPWGVRCDDLCVNVGYYDNISEFTIESIGELGDDPIDYIDRNLHVLCVEIDEYKKGVENLKKACLQNVKFENNGINGDIDISEDKCLCLTVPYNNGYEAKIDGKKVNYIKLNYMFVGIKVSKGTHHVELIYETPGLKLGCIIMITTVILLFLYELYKRKRNTNVR